jgi:hypothetical protein
MITMFDGTFRISGVKIKTVREMEAIKREIEEKIRDMRSITWAKSPAYPADYHGPIVDSMVELEIEEYVGTPEE